MSTPKHHKWISGLLLICSVVSLLLFLQSKCFLRPPGIDGQALAAAFTSERSSLELYSLFTGSAIAHSQFSIVSGLLAPTILLLTSILALWNFGLWKRQSEH
jgi:hypothetical protein